MALAPSNHTPTTSTLLLDLVFCSDPLFFNNVWVSAELGESDHCSLSWSLKTPRLIFSIHRRKVWLYHKANFDVLNATLEYSLPPVKIITGGDMDKTCPMIYNALMDQSLHSQQACNLQPTVTTMDHQFCTCHQKEEQSEAFNQEI